MVNFKLMFFKKKLFQTSRKKLGQIFFCLLGGFFLTACQSITTVKDVPWNKQNSLFLFEEDLVKNFLRLDKEVLKDAETIFVQLEFPKQTPNFCQREEFFRHLQNAILKSRKFEFLFPIRLWDERTTSQNDWRLLWQVSEKTGYCDWNGILQNDFYKLKLHSSYTKKTNAEIQNSENKNSQTTKE